MSKLFLCHLFMCFFKHFFPKFINVENPFSNVQKSISGILIEQMNGYCLKQIMFENSNYEISIEKAIYVCYYIRSPVFNKDQHK